LSVCEELRRRGSTAWIIFLTATNNVNQIELALDSGADDYVTKPFDVRELSARVRRALRRSGTALQPELRVGDVILDVSKRTLNVNGQIVALTPKESGMLEYLMRHPNKLVSTNKLLAAVWPSNSASSGGTVRTFMRNLRLKLDAAGKEDLIKTVLGAGYTIEISAARAR
jgi:OmpR-family two-component system manganese-sensing response regulator